MLKFLMGGGKSKAQAVAETINNTMLSITTSVIQNCSAFASQDQLINIRGNTGVIDMRNMTISQGATVNLSCALSASNKQQIISSISSMLSQTAASSTGFAATGKSKAVSSGKITNTVSSAVNNLTQQNLQSIISQRQEIDASNNSNVILMRGTTISQSAAIVAQGIVNSITSTGLITEIANSITQDSDSGSGGIDDIFSSISEYIMYIVIFIVIIVVAIAGVMLWPSDDDRDERRERKHRERNRRERNRDDEIIIE